MGKAKLEAWWVDLDSMETYEIGAMLVALLLFPETEGTPRFRDVHSSICALAVRQRAKRDETYAGSVQRFRPMHLVRPDVEVQRDLRTMMRRLRNRMLAGRLCNVKLTSLTGAKLDLPAGIKSTSINDLINLTLADLDSVDAVNVTERIWRESRPVMHLAAAVQAFIASRPEGQRPRAVGDIIFEPWAINEVARLTGENELLIRVNQKKLDMEGVASRLIPIRIGRLDKKN